MKKDFELAIVGPREVVLGFKAIGLHTVFSMNAEETLEQLQALKEERTGGEGAEDECKYAIIFILESHAKEIPVEDYKKITADALPAIIAIPGPEGATGFGMERLGQIVEKAIGSNILK
jgi:V/A-type H+/Na+-transporting ATPase subunit F